MTGLYTYRQAIDQAGYVIIPDVYLKAEISQLISQIEQTDHNQSTFRKTSGLFAIRQFLKCIPGTAPILFNQNIRERINDLFGERFFVVKSIYFDKPGSSNWFVAYHQDLTISVKERTDVSGFGPWTVKQGQFAVQPPLDILERNFTIRIHLDDTDETNGALRVLPGSHNRGVIRPDAYSISEETADTCCVPAGGIMIMKPLLLHASSRSSSHRRRRVIHIELSNAELPDPLEWSERLELPGL